jgi:uncharacterized phage protein (TIGR01671 family)
MKDKTREIKFRAWHKLERKMYKVNQIEFDDFGFISKVGWFSDKLGRPLFCQTCSEVRREVELMQYTGLKDKNGKEIYEGDIVECGDWVPDAHCLNTWENVVKWDIDTASFVGVDGEENRVIGNIYENPELLTPSPKG